MLRSIDHFIGGSTFASGERQGDVFDPNQGEVQANVRFGTAAGRIPGQRDTLYSALRRW